MSRSTVENYEEGMRMGDVGRPLTEEPIEVPKPERPGRRSAPKRAPEREPEPAPA